MKNLFGFLFALALAFPGTALIAADVSPGTNGVSNVPVPATCQIRNLKFHRLLRPLDANRADGTPLTLYPAQPWKCMTWKIQETGATGFQVRNLFTAKTFAAPLKSSNRLMTVTQVPFPEDSSAATPLWEFSRLEDGSYRITEQQSKMVLTAIQEADGYSFKIMVEAWKDRDEQKWILEKIDPKQLTM